MHIYNDEFKKTFLLVHNKHASIKSKVLRANHVPCMSKTLLKAITRRSSCSRLYKKEVEKFFRNLKLSFVTDNKNFRKEVKPLLTKQEVCDGVCLPTLLSKVNTLPRLEAISLVKMEIYFFSNGHLTLKVGAFYSKSAPYLIQFPRAFCKWRYDYDYEYE